MIRPSKIAILILINLFLVTNLVGAFGFVCCEKGLASEVHHQNHHTDDQKNQSPEGHALFHTQHLTGHGDTCYDYLIQPSTALSDKTKDTPPPIATTTFPTYTPVPNPAHVSLYVHSTYLKSMQITSQTLLTQRTVVLLN